MTSIEPNRKSAFERIEKTIKSTKDIREEQERGQMSLWGDEFDEDKTEEIIESDNVKDWSDEEKLEREKKILGFYITGHPLEKHQDIIDNYTSSDASKMAKMKKTQKVHFVATITGIRKIKTRNNKTMIILSFEDMESQIDGILFQGAKIKASIKENEIVWVNGTIEQDNDPKSGKTSNQVKINEILSIDKVVETKTTDVEVYAEKNDMEKLEKLKKIALESKRE